MYRTDWFMYFRSYVSFQSCITLRRSVGCKEDILAFAPQASSYPPGQFCLDTSVGCKTIQLPLNESTKWCVISK